VGRRDEAVKASAAAVGRWQSLTARHPPYAIEAAVAVRNHAVSLEGVGRNPEALELVRQTVDDHRPLARADPEFYGPSLLKLLVDLSKRFWVVGMHTESSETIDEVIDLASRAEASDPVVLRELAENLDELAMRLSRLGRYADAAAQSERGVAMLERLGQSHPTLYGDLARGLANLAVHLANVQARTRQAFSSQSGRLWRIDGRQPIATVTDWSSPSLSTTSPVYCSAEAAMRKRWRQREKPSKSLTCFVRDARLKWTRTGRLSSRSSRITSAR
jgi:hypothetical protein